eukprot:8037-Heterococcus_DN1.PRE.2
MRSRLTFVLISVSWCLVQTGVCAAAAAIAAVVAALRALRPKHADNTLYEHSFAADMLTRIEAARWQHQHRTTLWPVQPQAPQKFKKQGASAAPRGSTCCQHASTSSARARLKLYCRGR